MDFDFSENTTVDSLEKVPQDFRGLYRPVEGEDSKFELASDDDSVKSAVAAVTSLNKALKASRAEAKAHKGKQVDLTPLADFGDSPDAILESFNSKIEELNESIKKKGGDDLKRQVDKIKADLADAHAEDLKTKDARIEGLTGQLHGILVENEARTALTEAGALDAELALPFIRQQVKVNEDDGKFAVSVVDGAGDARYSGVTGSPMTIKELVGEMKANQKYGPLFKSEAPNGGGTPPSGGGRKPGPFSRDTSQLSAIDKISQGLAKGQARRGRRAAG